MLEKIMDKDHNENLTMFKDIKKSNEFSSYSTELNRIFRYSSFEFFYNEMQLHKKYKNHNFRNMFQKSPDKTPKKYEKDFDQQKFVKYLKTLTEKEDKLTYKLAHPYFVRANKNNSILLKKDISAKTEENEKTTKSNKSLNNSITKQNKQDDRNLIPKDFGNIPELGRYNPNYDSVNKNSFHAFISMTRYDLDKNNPLNRIFINAENEKKKECLNYSCPKLVKDLTTQFQRNLLVKTYGDKIDFKKDNLNNLSHFNTSNINNNSRTSKKLDKLTNFNTLNTGYTGSNVSKTLGNSNDPFTSFECGKNSLFKNVSRNTINQTKEKMFFKDCLKKQNKKGLLDISKMNSNDNSLYLINNISNGALVDTIKTSEDVKNFTEFANNFNDISYNPKRNNHILKFESYTSRKPLLNSYFNSSVDDEIPSIKHKKNKTINVLGNVKFDKMSTNRNVLHEIDAVAQRTKNIPSLGLYNPNFKYVYAKTKIPKFDLKAIKNNISPKFKKFNKIKYEYNVPVYYQIVKELNTNE